MFDSSESKPPVLEIAASRMNCCSLFPDWFHVTFCCSPYQFILVLANCVVSTGPICCKNC